MCSEPVEVKASTAMAPGEKTQRTCRQAGPKDAVEVGIVQALRDACSPVGSASVTALDQVYVIAKESLGAHLEVGEQGFLLIVLEVVPVREDVRLARCARRLPDALCTLS
jgi:hypothetical protein